MKQIQATRSQILASRSQLLAQQDKMLDDIIATCAKTKSIGASILEELDEQRSMIENINTSLDSSSSSLTNRSFLSAIYSGITSWFGSNSSTNKNTDGSVKIKINDVSKNMDKDEDPFHTVKSTNVSEIISNNSSSVREFDKFISMQAVNGCWKLTEIAKYLHQSVDTLVVSKLSSIDNDQWATIIALNILNLKFKSDFDEWDLLATKAKKWLASSLNEKIITEATILAQRLISSF